MGGKARAVAHPRVLKAEADADPRDASGRMPSPREGHVVRVKAREGREHTIISQSMFTNKAAIKAHHAASDRHGGCSKEERSLVSKS